MDGDGGWGMAEAEKERERERRGPKTEDKYRPEKLEKVAQIKKLSCFFPHIYHPQFYPLWTPLEHKNLEYLNIHIPTFSGFSLGLCLSLIPVPSVVQN